MKLKSVLVASILMSMTATTAFAQELDTKSGERVEYKNKHAVETNSLKYNWFVSLGAGGQIYFSDHDKQMKFGDRIAPALDVAVGKWIIPSVGVRVVYSGLQAKGATQNGSYSTGHPVPGKGGHGYWLTKQKMNLMNFHADMLLNLNNLISGYNEKRVWSISPYMGLGVAHVFDSPKKSCPSANFGLLNSFRISSAFDINFDLRGVFLTDQFDNEEGHRPGEGLLSASLGITYKFKPRGWNRSKTIIRYDNGEINDLRAKLADAEKEIQRLKDALAAGNQKEVDAILKRVAATNIIVFKIGKSELTRQSRVNVGILANVIKSTDKDAVYTVTGYADAGTGTPELNQRLSKERAEVVYDCLVNEYGVNPDQLRIDYKGGVENMYYDDPRLSRAVITYYNED